MLSTLHPQVITNWITGHWNNFWDAPKSSLKHRCGNSKWAESTNHRFTYMYIYLHIFYLPALTEEALHTRDNTVFSHQQAQSCGIEHPIFMSIVMKFDFTRY